MRILVTGAGGYLGRGIVTALLDAGHEVIAVSHGSAAYDPRAAWISCDLFAVEDPYDAFGSPDIVLHAAWHDGFIHNSSSHMQCLPQHAAFLEAMAKSGVKMISGMGTMHEIGFFEGSIDEHTPCAPTTRYGIAKDALRRFTQLVCRENDVAFQWLRGYYIVGTSQEGASIFSKIAAAEAQGKVEFPFTAGQNMYDFLDYQDFCRQTAGAASQMETTGIINICSGYPEKLCERVERFLEEHQYKIRLAYGRYPDRAYDSKAVWGNNSKIDKIMEMQLHGKDQRKKMSH